MAGMLTGLYPSELGAHEGTLSPEATTLAEVLRDAGYETAGVSDNFLTHPAFGFGQGHDYYWQKNNCTVFSGMWFNHWRLFRYYEWFYHAFGYQYRGADHVNRAVFDWLERRDRDRPFYLMVHYMDTHYPYYVYDDPQNVSRRSRASSYLSYFDAQLVTRQSPKPPYATASIRPDQREDFWLRYCARGRLDRSTARP